MRDLKKNTQKLYYATYKGDEKVYKTDKNGDIVYTDIDGEKIPVEIGEAPCYSDPVEFRANITTSGGEGEARQFGVAVTDYEAVIVTMNKTLPIDELTLIWHENEPQYFPDGSLDNDSADYSVIAVRPTLNTVRYLLRKVQRDEND